MKLNIFLSYKDDGVKGLKPILGNSYEFRRGYDTNKAKKYRVYYQMNCYFCL